MKYLVIVPPTMEQGSASFNCRDSHWGSYRKDALIDYNIMRAHDGLPPIQRMPRGTKYEKIKE